MIMFQNFSSGRHAPALNVGPNNLREMLFLYCSHEHYDLKMIMAVTASDDLLRSLPLTQQAPPALSRNAITHHSSIE
jgi:hypothetical protein